MFSWSTHWFRVKFDVSADFVSQLSKEEEVLFMWDSSSEATLWDESGGAPIGAFSCAPPHSDVRDYLPVTQQLITHNRLGYYSIIVITPNIQ